MAKTSFILGLIGGILGFFSGIFTISFGSLGEVFSLGGAGELTGLGIAAIIFSIIAIIFSTISIHKPKLSGWVMIISGIAILICISLFGLLPALLVILGGIMALVKKK